MPEYTVSRLLARLSDPFVQRLMGTAVLSVLLISLLYSSGDRPQPAPAASPAPPALDIAPARPAEPRSDAFLWGRFDADCWVRLKRGEQLLVDRLFLAGDIFVYQSDGDEAGPPDTLLLGNAAAAEMYHRGSRLDYGAPAERRDSAVSILLSGNTVLAE